MHFQIYYNHNSTGEDIIFLKNYCANLNLQTETLNSNTLTKTHSFRKTIKFNIKNIPNILVIWTNSENKTLTEVKKFSIENFLNLNYLYTINNGFIETLTNTIHNNHKKYIPQIEKNYNHTIHELYVNLSKQNTNKTTVQTALHMQKSGNLLEL